MEGKLHPGGKKGERPSCHHYLAWWLQTCENNMMWTWQLKQQLHLCPGQLASPSTPPQPPERNYPLAPACLSASHTFLHTFLSVCLLFCLSAGCSATQAHTVIHTYRFNEGELYIQEYSGFTGLFMDSGLISFAETAKLLTLFSIPLLRVITSQRLYTCLWVCMQRPYMPALPKHVDIIINSCNYLQHLPACLSACLCASWPVCMQISKLSLSYCLRFSWREMRHQKETQTNTGITCK